MNKSIIIGIITIVAIVLAALGAALKWKVFADMVHDQIIQNAELKNGTKQWDRFEKLPIDIMFKVYIMEVKNPDAAARGDKIQIAEKGPYVYRETREKIDIDVSDDKISYFENQLYKFDQTASGKLSEDDEVTILNPALNGAIQMVHDQFINFITPFNEGIPYIFGSNNLFLKAKVKDILFSGIKVCDPSRIDNIPNRMLKIRVNIICSMFREQAKTIRIMRMDKDEKTILVSLLDHKNNTNDGFYTINSGIKDINSVGMIEEWNNSTVTKFWIENSTCSVVSGSRDSIQYPPFIKPLQILEVFNTDICRTVQLHFKEDLNFRDASGKRFILLKDTLASPKSYPQNKCYCIKKSRGIEDPNTGCYYNGLMDLYTCYGAPVILSLPHFLWADDIYKNLIDGCHPDEDKHVTYIDVQPDTGMPLRGSKRVQYNMFVLKTEKIDILTNMNDTLIPIIWVDEGVELNDKLYNQLDDLYLSKLRLINGVTWAMMGIGVAGVLVCIAAAIWVNRSEETIYI